MPFITGLLEDALNIDRESFNQMHPHFLYLQSKLHERLVEIFKDMVARSERRRKRNAVEERTDRRRRLLDKAREPTGVSYTIRQSASQQNLAGVDTPHRLVLINDTADWPTGAARQLAQNIAVARALADAHAGRNEAERDSIFLCLLTEVL